MGLTYLRNLLRPLHIAALVGAAALGAWGIADTMRLAGSEDLPISLERGGISVGFLALAITYAGILRWRGFTPLALPAFVMSSFAVALVFLDLRGAAKGFPPSDSPGRDLVISVACWGAALIVCSWLARF